MHLAIIKIIIITGHVRCNAYAYNLFIYSSVSSPMRKSRARGRAAASTRHASQSSSSRPTPPGSRASSSSSTTSTQRALNTASAVKRTHSSNSAMGTQQRCSPSPVNTTPAVEPVEQRWEESEGTYLHKKFKKMASAVQSEESSSSQQPETSNASIQGTISASISSNTSPSATVHMPSVPIPTVLFEKPNIPGGIRLPIEPPISVNHPRSQFPLKHSALSMVMSSAQPVQTAPSTLPLSSKMYVPAPSPSPIKTTQQAQRTATQQVTYS